MLTTTSVFFKIAFLPVSFNDNHHFTGIHFIVLMLFILCEHAQWKFSTEHAHAVINPHYCKLLLFFVVLACTHLHTIGSLSVSWF